MEPMSSPEATDTEDRVQNLATDTTAEGAGNGVTERAQVDILRNISNGIATKCAGNELYDESCKVHSEPPTKSRTRRIASIAAWARKPHDVTRLACANGWVMRSMKAAQQYRPAGHGASTHTCVIPG